MPRLHAGVLTMRTGSNLLWLTLLGVLVFVLVKLASAPPIVAETIAPAPVIDSVPAPAADWCGFAPEL